jgi:selenocysteine-specific elongation factor
VGHPRRFVVGTAGHIDHGKTALVKALTGVDTDRWEEEKRRGITIDLGFAPLPLGDDLQASVVDVPGHEGFVKNMLAGATGIDVALLVIAADEGVMPQTEEHLAIVELLGVQRGVPVLTKRDLVDDEWLALVRAEVEERLKGSRVRWEAPIAVSALTGAGLDELRAALVRVAGDLPERSAADLFRLPIDRVFAVAGAGTVVTGSTWSGTVAVGDSVHLLPTAGGGGGGRGGGGGGGGGGTAKRASGPSKCTGRRPSAPSRGVAPPSRSSAWTRTSWTVVM